MQEAYANAANGAADTEATFWAVAYTAGDFSVSYGESTTANHSLNGSTVVERELESLQATYTMGAMTVAASLYESDNVEGVSAIKYEETEISVSFAF